MIIDEKKIPKDESLNSTYNGTDKWMNSTEVIKLTTKNGGASITDEIPGGGIVKRRIAAQEKQIQSNFPPINSASDFVSLTPSSSEISISSRQSSEENHKDTQISKKSRIPIRSNSNLSVSSNNSSLGYSDLFQPSKIPVPEKKEKDVLLKPKVYDINEKTREALLSVNHPFLKIMSETKIYEAISFHRNDRVRVKELEDKEIDELKNYNSPVKIFNH